MKKAVLSILVLLSVFLSCKRSDVEDLKPIAVGVTVSFDNVYAGYGFPVKDTEVKFTNLSNGLVTTLKADANGVVSIDKISPGNYDIEAVQTFTPADYQNYTSTATENEVVFNGVLRSQNIVQSGTALKIELKAGQVGDWIFKQIHYAGSHTSNGASFRDQFIEVYNNSNQVLYADSLYIVQAYGSNSKLTAIDLASGFYQSGSKQYDWTKSIGMNDSKANTDYVYSKNIWMIPGSGKDYPVEPGKSLIIAGTALNHKAPFTDANGKTVTVKDPSLTIDLSGADFEIYLGDYPGITQLASDIDNPNVKNLVNVSILANNDLIIDATGREALFLFKTKRPQADWKRVPAPDKTDITAGVDLYYQIPNKEVLDAVEIQPPLEANRIPKKFGATLDATFIYASKGQYSSQSLLRKTGKTVGGRVILKDSNSSTNDFTELDIPDVTKTVFK